MKTFIILLLFVASAFDTFAQKYPSEPISLVSERKTSFDTLQKKWMFNGIQKGLHVKISFLANSIIFKDSTDATYHILGKSINDDYNLRTFTYDLKDDFSIKYKLSVTYFKEKDKWVANVILSSSNLKGIFIRTDNYKSDPISKIPTVLLSQNLH